MIVRSLLFACCLCLALSPRTAAAQTGGAYWMYIGSYTNTTAKGIYVSAFDAASGALTAPRLVAEAPFPAQVWPSPDGRFLYAANWQGTETQPGDTITAYAVDRRTGDLTFLNKVSAKGSGPNQVVIDPSGRMAIAVNYRTGSVAAFGIEADGSLTEAFYVDQHEGQPTPPSKQPGPRAHGVVFSSDSRHAYVADIGLDRVYGYRIDPARRSMAPVDPPYVVQPAGSGPRRLQLHPGGRYLYVNRETDSHVTVFSVDNGRLTELQAISTLPPGIERNTTAEILIDAAGRFLYVSNRGHGSIAVFAIGQDGHLKTVEFASSGARTPRNFSIDPTGRWLVASNQDTEELVVHAIDAKTGRLSMTASRVSLANPGSVAFIGR